MYHEIQIKFDYGEIDIYRSWIMALILLEDRDFNGFWMKIWNAGVSVITRSTFSSVVLWLSHATNLRLQWNIYTIYVHCWKMYNLSLRSLETGCKANLFQTFLACLAMSTKEFADILCLSCNVKKSKTTATLSENSWNKRRYNCFQWCSLWSLPLYCYRFFLSLYMNQLPKILY